MVDTSLKLKREIEELLASAVMGYEYVELDGVLYVVPEEGQLEIWQPLLNHSQLYRCYVAAREKWDAVAERDSSYNVAFLNALKGFIFSTKSRVRCTVFDEADLANAWAEQPFAVACAIFAAKQKREGK